MQHIDLEQILEPISEENPTGDELSIYEGTLLEISDAWDQARDLIDEERRKENAGGVDSQGQPWRTIPEPDWDPIITKGSQAIQTASKDFRIASWVAEALMRKHGFSGLNDGLSLCLEMCQRYWDNIRPSSNEEDGHGQTVSGFGQLASDKNALDQAVIVRGQRENARSETTYTLLDYRRAKELDLVSPEERQRRIEQENHVDVEDIRQVAALASSEFHRENLQLIEASLEKLRALSDFMRENCDPDEYDESTYPTVAPLEEALENARSIVRSFVGEEEPEDEDSPDEVNESSPSVGGSSGAGAMTREKAFKQIEDIARFFEKTEPHSPVQFALRQAVRWGRTPLPKLLSELIDDSTVMESLQKLIGLPEENDSYSDDD